MACMVANAALELAFADNLSSVIYVQTDGRDINMLRQVAWFLEIPVWIKLMVDALTISDHSYVCKNGAWPFYFKNLVAAETMLFAGFLALFCQWNTVWYWTATGVACAACGVFVYWIGRAYQIVAADLSNSDSRLLRFVVCQFYFCVVAIPLVFLIGPESLNLIDIHLENGIFQLIYTFAKCGHSVACWYLRYHLCPGAPGRNSTDAVRTKTEASPLLA